MKKYILLLGVLVMLAVFAACSNDEPTAPKPLESVGEKVFDAIEIENQKHISVTNDSGGIYIYGYPNQDVIETLLYRTVSAEAKKLAEQRLGDIELQHRKTENNIDIFATIDTQPGGLNYTSWYSLDMPNNMVVDITAIWDDINIFDMDTTLTVTDAKRNISVVRHSGSTQLTTLAGDIYVEIAMPDSGYCIAETGAGDIVVRVPQETSARIELVSQSGSVTVNNLEVNDQVEQSGSLSGVLGLGEGEITLATNRGAIVLNGF